MLGVKDSRTRNYFENSLLKKGTAKNRCFAPLPTPVKVRTLKTGLEKRLSYKSFSGLGAVYTAF